MSDAYKSKLTGIIMMIIAIIMAAVGIVLFIIPAAAGSNTVESWGTNIGSFIGTAVFFIVLAAFCFVVGVIERGIGQKKESA
ncbi:MAG: hypothetical protein AB1798_08920 [Spirochaetota bacterium]